jgi:8-oxo-dGTP diphosphatase
MENEEHFLGKVAQKAIIYRGDKVLLVRDPRMEELIWEIPGGRLNAGEEPKIGLVREIKEELGIDCNVEGVIFLKQFLQGNENAQSALVLVYKATIAEDAVLSPDPHEVCEIAWFSKDEALSLPLFPEYLEALKVFYSE